MRPQTALSVSILALASMMAAPALAQQDTNATPSSDQAATPAPAQAARQAPASGIEDVVVTAQKRNEDVQDVPIAISAFTSKALQERAVNDVSQLSALSPNVQLDASTPFSGSSAVLSAYIRGIGSNDFAFNIDPGVGTYVDGVYLGRSIGANQNLLDVDRIEVLKGPQGTLFGRNTIGGAISIVTHTPGDVFRFKGDVTTGSYQRLQIRGMVDVPIAQGLSSSVAFGMMSREGYQKRIPYPSTGAFVTDGYNNFVASGYETRERQGGDNNWNGRAKLHYDNGGAFRLTLTGDYSHIDEESTANTVVAVTSDMTGSFAATADRDIPGTALYNDANTAGPGGTALPSNGFNFAGLYNFCIGATSAEIAGRNAQNLCGPRAGINGYNTLPALASVNVDSNPLNNRLPYDSSSVNQNIDTTYANGNNFSKLNQGGLAGTVEFDVTPDITLKSITAYRDIKFRAGVDLDNSPLEILQTSFIVDQHQFSQEGQLIGKALDNKLHYVFGLYYFTESGNLHDFVTFAEGLLQVDGPGFINTKSSAAYGQIDYRLNDLIGITVGGRYTHEKKSYEGAQSDDNGFNYKLFNCTPPGTACATALGFPNPDQPLRYYVTGTNYQKFNNFSPKVGIQLHPTNRVMVYGSWSRGYKTGGWTTRLSNPLDYAPTFKPEKAESFEIGIKSEMLNRMLQVNAAVFTTNYSNIQLNFQQGISPTIQNAGDARIRGFEIAANAAPGGGFSLQASLGYIDAHYTNVLAPAQVAPSEYQDGVYVGAPLPKAPDWKFNVSPRFEIPIGGGSAVLLADWTHSTSLRNDTEGTILLNRPTTDMVNASVTFNGPSNYSLSFGGTNLTNDRYIITGQFQGAGGVVYGTYNRPPEWYARLAVNF